jgi:hypothetical protein
VRLGSPRSGFNRDKSSEMTLVAPFCARALLLNTVL